MCTVSFVSSNDKIIITSNRDEHVLRPAIEPKTYVVNSKNILFPKDPKAGGTWYAVDEKNGHVLVLLNGAAEKHVLNPPYRKSRGLIVLELISHFSPLILWEEMDLENIEPFTLVLYCDSKLYQLRWDENEKETKNLDPSLHYIWSSSTLYPAAIRDKRKKWFYTFLDTKPSITETEMFNFHRYTENDNIENGLVIDRNNNIKTLSITQTVIEKNKLAIIYSDLIKQTESTTSFIV